MKDLLPYVRNKTLIAIGMVIASIAINFIVVALYHTMSSQSYTYAILSSLFGINPEKAISIWYFSVNLPWFMLGTAFPLFWTIAIIVFPAYWGLLGWLLGNAIYKVACWLIDKTSKLRETGKTPRI